MIISQYIETYRSNLNNITVTPNQLIYCKDSLETYYDTDEYIRTKLGDIIYVNTERDKRAIKSPIPNKIYLVTESYRMYVYANDRWNQIAGGSGSGGGTIDMDFIKDELDYDTLEARVEALEYKNLVISSFKADVMQAEIGRVLSTIKFTWNLNKDPSEYLKFNDTTISTSARSHTLTGQNVTSNKTYTLKAKDRFHNEVKQTATIQFYKPTFYGAASYSGTVTNAFILSLTKSLTTIKTFAKTAGANQYFWYAIPSSMGTCEFKIGGFSGGFILESAMQFTNSYGHTEEYLVYRSDNSNIGYNTIDITIIPKT